MKLSYKSNSSVILAREYSYIQKSKSHQKTKRFNSLNYLSRINLYLSICLLPFLFLNFPLTRIGISLIWLFILTLQGMKYYFGYDKQLIASIIEDHNSRIKEYPYSTYEITDTHFIWTDLGNSYSLFLKNLIKVENNENCLTLTFSDFSQIYMVSELFSSHTEQSQWATKLKKNKSISNHELQMNSFASQRNP